MQLIQAQACAQERLIRLGSVLINSLYAYRTHQA